MATPETATDPERGTHRMADLVDMIGRELAVSDWITIDQPRVDQFGISTEHRHWLHLDPDRAAREGSYGGTIAHGFLVTSLLSFFTDNVRLRPADAAFALNYGFEKVRYLAPVVVGEGVRVRDRISILDATWRSGGRLMLKTGNSFEVEGSDDPVAYAEWLVLWVPMGATT